MKYKFSVNLTLFLFLLLQVIGEAQTVQNGPMHSPTLPLTVTGLNFNIQMVTATTGNNLGQSQSNYLLVYPSPSNGIFNIKYDNKAATKKSLRIITVKGQVVYSKSISLKKSGTEQVDISSFAKGFYFVELIQDNKVTTQKIQIR